MIWNLHAVIPWRPSCPLRLTVPIIVTLPPLKSYKRWPDYAKIPKCWESWQQSVLWPAVFNNAGTSPHIMTALLEWMCWPPAPALVWPLPLPLLLQPPTSPESLSCITLYKHRQPPSKQSSHAPQYSLLLFVLSTLHFSCRKFNVADFKVQRILMNWDLNYNFKRLIKKLSPTFVIILLVYCFKCLVKISEILLKTDWPDLSQVVHHKQLIFGILIFDIINFLFFLDVWFPWLWVIYFLSAWSWNLNNLSQQVLFILTVNILNFLTYESKHTTYESKVLLISLMI